MNRKEALLLLIIIVLAVAVRMQTYSDNHLQSMADPYFFYRTTGEIIDNNYQLPQWDYLSHADDGRPFTKWPLFSLSSAYVYRIANGAMNLFEIMNIMPILFIVLTGLVVFYCMRKLYGSYAAMFSLILVMFLPQIISMSYAGYADTDSPVVFFMASTLLVSLLAIKTEHKLYLASAIILQVLFLFAWFGAWFPMMILTLCFVIFVLLNIKNLKNIYSEIKSFAIIFLTSNVIASLLGRLTIFEAFFQYMNWSSMDVNVSVAELMGAGPEIIIASLGIPCLILVLAFIFISLMKKDKISFENLSLIIFLVATSIMSMMAIRYSLMLSLIAALVGGAGACMLIGKIYDIKLRNIAVALIGFGMILVILSSLQYVNDNGPSQQWIEAGDWLHDNAQGSLVVTYWDPGHFLTAQGVKVLFDGAHCPASECFYDHNERLYDITNALLTSNETMFMTMLEKYSSDEDTYLLISGDLVQKFPWLSYFSKSHFVSPDSIGAGAMGYSLAGSTNEIVRTPWIIGSTRNDVNETSIYSTFQMPNNKIVYAECSSNNCRSGIIENNMNVEFCETVLENNLYYSNQTNCRNDLLVLYVTQTINKIAITNAVYVPEELKDSMFIKAYYKPWTLDDMQLVFNNGYIKILKVMR